MTSFTQNRITVAMALLLPAAASLWLLMRSDTAVPGAYAVLLALVTATAVVGHNAWKNGQPTGSVGQLIHEMDITPSPTANDRPSLDAANAARWDAWQIRGKALAETGRVRALLALSVAGTATLVYVWGA